MKYGKIPVISPGLKKNILTGKCYGFMYIIAKTELQHAFIKKGGVTGIMVCHH